MFNINKFKSQKTNNISVGAFGNDLMLKLFSELLNMICSILTFRIFASSLTRTEYSVTNQLISIGALLVPIILLRINTAYCAFLPGEKDLEKIKSRFFSSLFISVLQCFIVIIAILLNKSLISYGLFGTKDYVNVIPIISIFYVLFSLNTLVHEFYRAIGKISKSTMLVSLNAILKATIFITITLINNKMILREVVIIYCLTEFVIFLMGLFSIIYSYKGIPFIFDYKALKEYYSYSLPLVPYSIFAWINTSIGKLMINHLMDLEYSGIYIFNYSLVLRVFILNTAVGYTVFPHISKAWNRGNKKQVSSYILKAYNIGIFLGFPISLGLIAVLPTVVNLLSKGNYVSDKLMVGLFCASMILNMLYTVFSYLIDLSRKTIWYTIILFLTSAFNIIISFVLIPRHGLYGAAIAYLLTNLLQVILVIVIGTKISNIGINISVKYTIKCFIISLLMYILTVSIYKESSLFNFLLSVLTGVITYFGLHYIISKITNEPLI